MSIRAIYPIGTAMDVILTAPANHAGARELYMKIRTMQDSGATMIILSGMQYDLFQSIHEGTLDNE